MSVVYQRRNGREEAGNGYASLTNEELQRLLCERMPHMVCFVVDDQSRGTVIAMLRITDRAK